MISLPETFDTEILKFVFCLFHKNAQKQIIDLILFNHI